MVAGKLVSHTVVFVGSAAFVSLVVVAAAERRWQRATDAVVAGVVSAAGVLTIYLSLDRRAATASFRDRWEQLETFPPTNEGVRGVLHFVVDRYEALEGLLGLGSPWLSIPLILAGLVTLVYARRRAVALTVLFLLVELVIAGVAERYPLLHPRTSHFLLVMFAVIAAIGVSGLAAVARRASFTASLLVAFLAVGLYVMEVGPNLRGHTSITAVDTSEQVRDLSLVRHPGDATLVSVRAIYSFGYYWRAEQPRFTPNPKELPAFSVKYPASAHVVAVQATTHPEARTALISARRMARAGSGRLWIVREFFGGALAVEPVIWAKALEPYAVRQTPDHGPLLFMPVVSAKERSRARLRDRGGGGSAVSWRGEEVPVVPGAAMGFVDRVAISNGRVAIDGWAFDANQRATPDWVLAFVNGRLLAAGIPAAERPDVVESHGKSA